MEIHIKKQKELQKEKCKTDSTKKLEESLKDLLSFERSRIKKLNLEKAEILSYKSKYIIDSTRFQKRCKELSDEI